MASSPRRSLLLRESRVGPGVVAVAVNDLPSTVLSSVDVRHTHRDRFDGTASKDALKRSNPNV
jgi:hypothetical protein